MKTIHLISISAAVALTTLAFSVGCAPAPVQSFEPDDDDDGKSSKKNKDDDDDDEKTSSSKKSTKSTSEKGEKQSSSSSSGGAPPGGEVPGGEIPGGEIPGGGQPGDDPAEACYLQCIQSNPAAVQLDNMWLACADKCGDQDEACFEACDNQMFQACNQNQAACEVLFECGDKCFGGREGP